MSNRLTPFLVRVALLLGVGLILAGYRAHVRALRQAVIAQATGPNAASGPPPAPPPLSLEAPLSSLSPVPGGTGIVVCEPVAQQASAAIGDFGAGCGRWLCYTVGGQPELGRTPLWSEVQRAQWEEKKPNLRLSLPDAVTLGSALGVTHVAVGTITGTPTHCTLTYQLWAVPNGRAVGGPLRASGTPSQMIASLPALARQMAQRLGVATPRVPPTVGARPADLVLAGQVPWGPEGYLAPAQSAALQLLAAHWPLAALLTLDTGLRGDRQLPAVANALLTQSPDNPFAYAQLAYVQPANLRPSAAALAARRRLFPNNYIWAHTDVWWERQDKNPQSELLAAQQAVCDAPGNPDAWLTLGFTLGNQAEFLRSGRTADALSSQEWQTLNGIYPRWLAAVSRAARLDPRYGKAWQRVSQAATFDGEASVADTAFWNALRYDPDHVEVYEWGLQMYQQKWGGDSATLAKVASLAAADHYATVGQAITVAGDLDDAGFTDQAQSLMDRRVAAARVDIQRSPGNADAHWDLAAALRQQHHLRQAIAEYQAAARLDPANAALHHEYAATLDDLHLEARAIPEYQAAVRLEPDNSEWHYDLGWDLKHSGQMASAEREMRLAVQTDPGNPDAHFGLGEVLAMTNRETLAIPEYQKTANTAPYPFEADRRLLYLQDKYGQYGAAIAAGQRVLSAYPDDCWVLDNLADCYLNKKQWQTSIDDSQQALKANPNDALAHLNLGEADIGQGDKSGARAEWRKAADLDHGQFGQDARDLLAKNP